MAEKDGHRLPSVRNPARRVYPQYRPSRTSRVVFFTDRSLYRPGQSISFKGIYINIDQEANNYEVIANENLTVRFWDVNREEIESLNVHTNDYGSFSGSFTAPRDRLAGTMAIGTTRRYIRTQRQNYAYVNVEEYKRPTFEVELHLPEESPRLGETVRIPGKAIAYTGAPTGGAQVRWRVKRRTRYPRWWSLWRRTPGADEEQEIAHGTAETDPDGTFNIEFPALPTPDAREEGDPVFRYDISADVTDAAGETRSAQREVNVGFTALNAELSADEWIEQDRPFNLSVRTRSLDGEPKQAGGILKIYSLQAPEKVHRKPLAERSHPAHTGLRQSTITPEPGPYDPNTWPLDEVLTEETITTDGAGYFSSEYELNTGAYRVVLKTEDRFGNDVRAELPLIALDPDAEHLDIPAPHLFKMKSDSVEPGETFTALWGSGYDEARAYVEIRHRDDALQQYWTDPGRSQHLITQEVTEELRGGFSINVTMIKENRAYFTFEQVDVPWTDKELDITWERFTSKLEPGGEEKWTAIVEGPDSERAAAEMVATLYDRSLDAFLPHRWRSRLGPFYRDRSTFRSNFENVSRGLRAIEGQWGDLPTAPSIRYRSFPREVTGLFISRVRRRVYERSVGDLAAAEAPADKRDEAEVEEDPEEEPEADIDHVEARKDLDETAFFFPHLTADEDGVVRMEFTMPETLTGWRFMGFAHDENMRSGLITATAVTAKDLMVQPNPPRFMREGDVLEFTVRVTNQSPERQKGRVRLEFECARTGEDFDEKLNNLDSEKEFDVPAGQTRAYSWRLEVPEQPGVLIYRAVGSSRDISDGEEGYLPVLSRRIMLTESIPFYIHGPGERTFRHEKLLESGDSATLEHKTLTMQAVSNPAWYAVLALPYMMEFPHNCSEQVFNRLYANRLAEHIAGSDPKVRRIFDQWKEYEPEALESPLEKNEDLKEVMLEETPWLRQAQCESRARRNIGVLFDKNRLEEEAARTLHHLSQMQYADGSWPWFAGGPPSDYMTLYITTGFARLRHLGVVVDMSPAYDALERLDNWLDKLYRDSPESPGRRSLSPMIAMYLYMRTFFLDDHPLSEEHREAFDHYIERAKEHWGRIRWRKSQAHLALALNRIGEKETARAIMRSIKERSVTDEELGRFWRDSERSWWWYRAPIETQALMIEAFDEVMDDQEAVEECRTWLLAQKRTQHWRSTKATADAVYGLLLRGTDMLASDELLKVSLGEREIEPEDPEAGTGFYEKRFAGDEIEPEMGEITVEKQDEGTAWGGLHWQYLEDIANVTAHEATPLQLEKRVYTKEHTERGPVLSEIDGPVAVGDELVQRIVLRTDRDMEYVHLKDYRGSGTEPTAVLSRYRFQDGLRYYQTTRDTATHFFIDYLPKGTYVLEYSVHVQHKGTYETGIAKVECMYAPEFNSHSESFELEVE